MSADKPLQKSYHIWTMGCQMNEADSRRLASELEGFGYRRVGEPEQADIVVLNTCVVRQQAENKIYGRLGSLKPLKEKNPNMVVGLMGCFVGVKEAPRLRQTYPFVDVFMAPSDTRPMLDYLEANALEDEERRQREVMMDAPYQLPAEDRGKVITANVSLVLGCSHVCSYCIIPSRRGGERSRQPEEVLKEIAALAEQGVREVVLLGQIVDRYGMDLEQEIDLADLLLDVNEIANLERIRFMTSHPTYMTDKLLDAVASLDKVCAHLEVPIQAGSDEVLESMRRGYTASEYRDLVQRIRVRIPDASINTDIIVGFCGETDDQFMQTYEIIRDLRFDKVHIAKYSPRPNTLAAAKMEDDVPADEKERRRKMLDDLQKSILEEKNAKYLDQEVSVLVESKQKGRWRGRNPHNRLVFFDDDRDLLGQVVQVKIEHTSPYSLIGRAVDAVQSTEKE